MMFFPPNPLKESNSNKVKEPPKIGPFSIGEIYQLLFASLLGTVIWMQLGKWVLMPNAFIAGLTATIGFYLLVKRVKLPTKND